MRIYLASPYTHQHRSIRSQRHRDVCKAAAQLIERNNLVYSPIAHSHAIAVHGKLEGDWSSWQPLCVDMLENWAELLIILMLNGWEHSIGIKHEKELAHKLQMPTIHWAPGAPVEALDLLDIR